MPDWDLQYLGATIIPPNLSSVEIEHFFTLRPSEIETVSKSRGASNRLGLALHIGFLRLSGTLLNSTDLIPEAVLRHIGRQIAPVERPPQIASIRSLYRRRGRTLFDHQQAAAAILGFRKLVEGAERNLLGYLRKEAWDALEDEELAGRIRKWLHEHNYFSIGERPMRSLLFRARRMREDDLAAAIAKAVPADVRETWLAKLLEAPSTSPLQTRLDWLREGPKSRKGSAVAEEIGRVEFLKALGAEALNLGISIAALQHFARPLQYRKPSSLHRLRAEPLEIEIACFLRLQLLRHSDTAAELIDRRIADLWRQARDRVEARQDDELRRYRRLVMALQGLAADGQIPAEDFRRRVRELLTPFAIDDAPNKVTAIRMELANDHVHLRSIIDAARRIDVVPEDDHVLHDAFRVVDDTHDKRRDALPTTEDNPFGVSWEGLITQADRTSAYKSYVAATTMLLKRSLKNGSAAIDHSLCHKRPADRMIPKAEWLEESRRHIKALGVDESSFVELSKMTALLEARLGDLAEAVADGRVSIRDGSVIIPKPVAEEVDPKIVFARRTVFGRGLSGQLPDVIIEIDARTRFSWILLGRRPRSESELINLYCALVALGTDLSAADLVRMVPQAVADSITQMMVRLEAKDVMEAANHQVLDFMRGYKVTRLWGPGIAASADMMSLDAQRQLWSARTEPRRKGLAIGTYAHVMDQWGVIYNQPIILNKRQAGAAIEGALRQRIIDIDRVAVDTHGFTHFGMAFAKVLGFDLCPRLADLKDRKLHLPRRYKVADELAELANPTVRVADIHEGWDDFLRLASSVKSGRCSATFALDRFGSAARGETIFKAGDAFGKILRTIYLCDYLANEAFRTTILKLLNQGESVHFMERAIHNGNLGPKRGRTEDQLAAISGALSLIANILMTWNTLHIESVRAEEPEILTDDIVSKVAPVAHGHFNLRGLFKFDLGAHRSTLLEPSRNIIQRRAKPGS
jgi:TnpA family transposase